MSTILFDKIVFGPVHSRRLGVSLGMNLLPVDGKPALNLFICHGFPSSREPLIKSARADSERFFTR